MQNFIGLDVAISWQLWGSTWQLRDLKCWHLLEDTVNILKQLKMVLGPPEYSAIGYVHKDNLPLGRRYCITHMSFQTFCRKGLMVFSDDFQHFLKIKKKFVEFTKDYLVALTILLGTNPITTT